MSTQKDGGLTLAELLQWEAESPTEIDTEMAKVQEEEERLEEKKRELSKKREEILSRNSNQKRFKELIKGYSQKVYDDALRFIEEDIKKLWIANDSNEIFGDVFWFVVGDVFEIDTKRKESLIAKETSIEDVPQISGATEVPPQEETISTEQNGHSETSIPEVIKYDEDEGKQETQIVEEVKADKEVIEPTVEKVDDIYEESAPVVTDEPKSLEELIWSTISDEKKVDELVIPETFVIGGITETETSQISEEEDPLAELRGIATSETKAPEAPEDTVFGTTLGKATSAWAGILGGGGVALAVEGGKHLANLLGK